MDFIEPGYKYIKISHWPAIGSKISPGNRKLDLELTFSTKFQII